MPPVGPIEAVGDAARCPGEPSKRYYWRGTGWPRRKWGRRALRPASDPQEPGRERESP